MAQIGIIILLIIFLGFLAYPVFGLIQVLNSIQRYREKGWHPNFYRDIRTYWKILLAYTLVGIVLWIPEIRENISYEIYEIYLFGFSLPIAIYNIAIMYKKHPEFIEI